MRHASRGLGAVGVGFGVAVALAALGACSSDGGSEEGFYVPGPGTGSDASGGSDAGTTPGSDSSTPQDGGPDGPIVYPDPLQGLPSLTATRVGTMTFTSTEGTLWLASEQKLIFSDIDVNGANDTTVRTYDPVANSFGVFRAQPTGRVNGQALDGQGLVIQCEGTGRRIVRRSANGTYQTVASQIDDGGLKKFTAPNDLIGHSNGTIFFTDPGYVPAGANELGYYATFRIAPNGTVSIVGKNADRPNGVALSPDEKTLYVGDANNIKTFDLNAAGEVIAGPKQFAATGTDGMTVDDAGNLYVGRSGGVRVFKPDGSTIGDISVSPKTFGYNVAFGDADRRTLYIAAGNWLMKIRTNVPGKP